MRKLKWFIASVLLIVGTWGCGAGSRNNQFTQQSQQLVFQEQHPENLGNILPETIELKRWSWNRDVAFGSSLEAGVHYNIEGPIPEGLTFQAKVINRNQLELSFLGQAINHHVSDSVEGILFSLSPKAFLNESEKALQEEFVEYPIRIQFGVGYPVTIINPPTQTDTLTVEIERTGEEIHIDPNQQNQYTTETLFEVGDHYEVRIKTHAPGKCCFVQSSRGTMLENGNSISNPIIGCNQPQWTFPSAHEFMESTSINSNHEHILNKLSHNGFGEFLTTLRPIGQNQTYFTENFSTSSQSLFSQTATLETIEFTIPNLFDDYAQAKLDKGTNVFAWIRTDLSNDPQVYLASFHRNYGTWVDSQITHNALPKTNLHIQLVSKDQFYLFWIEDNNHLRFVYFDGKEVGTPKTLYQSTNSIQTLKTASNGASETLVAWTVNQTTTRLHFQTLKNGATGLSEPTNQPISFSTTSVVDFEVQAHEDEKRIVWTQQDTNGLQYNLYEAYFQGYWNLPTSNQYFRSEPTLISNLRLLSNADGNVSLVWGYVNASNRYQLRTLDRLTLSWGNLQAPYASTTTSTIPVLHAHINLKGSIFLTWSHPQGQQIYRRLRINGNWLPQSTTPVMSDLQDQGGFYHQSSLSDYDHAIIAWEGRVNDQYHIYLSETHGDSPWADPTSNTDSINPPSSYFTTLQTQLSLQTSQSCGASQLVWTQKVENTNFGNIGRQVFKASFK